MTEEQKQQAEKKKDEVKRIAWDYVILIAIAALLFGFLCWLYAESGKDLTVEAMGAIAGIVAGLVVLGKKMGANIVGPGVLVLTTSIILSGCGIFCTTERGVVADLEAGLAVTEEVVSDQDNDILNLALETARSVLDVASQATEECHSLIQNMTWPDLVDAMLDVVQGVKWSIESMNGSEDVQVPPELDAAILELEREQQIIDLLESL